MIDQVHKPQRQAASKPQVMVSRNFVFSCGRLENIEQSLLPVMPQYMQENVDAWLPFLPQLLHTPLLCATVGSVYVSADSKAAFYFVQSQRRNVSSLGKKLEIQLNQSVYWKRSRLFAQTLPLIALTTSP